MYTDGKRGVKAKDYMNTFEQIWKPYFGYYPDVIRMDPKDQRRLMKHFQQQGIMLDSIPAEQLPIQAIWTWSQGEVVRGFSPFQHVLGCMKRSQGQEIQDTTSSTTMLLETLCFTSELKSQEQKHTLT